MKKSFIFFVFLFCFVVFSWAQNTELQESDSSNVKSVRRVSIPGSVYSLIPPLYFTPIQNDSVFGFIHTGAMASIQVKIIDGIPYTYLARSITDENMQQQKVSIVVREQVFTNSGKPAELILLSFELLNLENNTPVVFERMILLTGDYQNTIWIDANYPVIARNLLLVPLRESLLSVEF